jgi:hypothetical protein
MSEENDKKSILEKLADWALKTTLFQMKNQLAEIIKGNRINLNFTLFGKTTIINQPPLPPNTNPQTLSEMLDQIAPKEPPELTVKTWEDIEESWEDSDIEWVHNQLDTAAQTAVTSVGFTMASMDAILVKGTTPEGTDTSKAVDLTGNGPMIKDSTPQPKPKKDDDVDEGERI